MQNESHNNLPSESDEISQHRESVVKNENSESDDFLEAELRKMKKLEKMVDKMGPILEQNGEKTGKASPNNKEIKKTEIQIEEKSGPPQENNEQQNEEVKSQSSNSNENNQNNDELLHELMASVRQCIDCQRALLITSSKTCSACNNPICAFCEDNAKFAEGLICQTCRNNLSGINAQCSWCEIQGKSDSMQTCIKCEQQYCEKCAELNLKGCANCESKECSKCLTQCSDCKFLICSRCLKKCKTCQTPYCIKCATVCQKCKWKLTIDSKSAVHVKINENGTSCEAVDHRSNEQFVVRGDIEFAGGYHAYEVGLRQVQRDCAGYGFGIASEEQYKDYLQKGSLYKDFSKFMLGITANNAGMSLLLKGTKSTLKPGQIFKVCVDIERHKLSIIGPETKLFADLMPGVKYIPVFTRCHGRFAISVNSVYEFI